MRVVWKQPLTPAHTPQDIKLPGGARILHVDKQEGVLTLWFLVDPDTPDRVTRRFQIYGTGNPVVPNTATYLGTVQHGWYVWHLFELVIPEDEW
jgi:hypothetical protein